MTSRHTGRPFGLPQLLRLLRRTIAVLMFLSVALFLTGSAWGVALHFKWAARIQLVPVIMSVSITGIVILLAVTFIFGRIYCSTVCPMGFFQDVFARLLRHNRKAARRHRYRYVPARNVLRYSWLAIVTLTSAAGITILLTLTDPYSAFSRMAVCLVRPLIVTDTLVPLAAGTLTGIIVAASTFLGIALWSFRTGRSFCNTLCPAGAALSLCSRHSLYRMDINTDLCINCHLCEDLCKARCIDTRSHTVDASRCVVCFDCIGSCPAAAIRYTRHRFRLSIPMMIKVPETAQSAVEKPQPSPARPIDRRRFLATGLIVAAAPVVAAADRKMRHFDAVVPVREPSTDHRPVFPPGHGSDRSFITRCTGCGACIAACPGQVLRPASLGEGSFSSTLHPVMNYDLSYCRYNCNICTRTCPTGALTPQPLEVKQAMVIGLAMVEAEACIGCGKCVGRCPRHAIKMTKTESGRRVVTVDHANCIGCGSCQYICPATPRRAIVVNGLRR